MPFELRGFQDPEHPSVGERVLTFVVDEAAHKKAGGTGLAPMIQLTRAYMRELKPGTDVAEGLGANGREGCHFHVFFLVAGLYGMGQTE